MRHLLKIILVLILPTAAILIVAISGYWIDPGKMTEALIKDYLRTFLHKTGTIEQIVPASLPQNFQLSQRKTWFTSVSGEPQGSLTPPIEIWCVRLNSSDPTVPRTVLVAFYQDYYGTYWIVHEVNDPKSVLAAVGCSLPNQ